MCMDFTSDTEFEMTGGQVKLRSQFYIGVEFTRLVLIRSKKLSFLGMQEVIKTKAVNKIFWIHVFRSDIH